MKKIFYRLSCFCLLSFAANCTAQEFVTRAKIEFEKKENVMRSLSNSGVPMPSRDMFPEFHVTYYDLTFAGNQALYKAGRDNDPPPSASGRQVIFGKNNNVRYSNYVTGQAVIKRDAFQEEIVFEDSIPSIKWKIGQETRKIAGYECRKAVGIIYDSVYVVAFYAEEIIAKGGPEGIQGLPGMILGMAIPRYNTTWFATKVELANIDESQIVAPYAKGKKISTTETKTRLVKKFEQMGMKNASTAVDRYFKAGYFL